jgi:transglutaminase-like putative cysteine protease
MENAEYLLPSPAINCDHPAVIQFVEQHSSAETMSRQEIAVSLYYAVRDLFRYDPYRLDLTVDGMKASATLDKGYGWCVSKAVLLTACCRAKGIPARLGFGDVRNHLSTNRLREMMKTDIFYWHGYTEIFLNGKWVKATPAFNLQLCEKFNLAPLEFDGTDDSVFHPFDVSGNRHMEYVRDRGYYADLPLAEIIHTFRTHYRLLLQENVADFGADVEQERVVPHVATVS